MNNRGFMLPRLLVKGFFVFLLAVQCFGWTGSGTSEDPWQIGSVNDVYNLSYGTTTNSYAGKYFVQNSDIAFPDGYAWQAHRIGDYAKPFAGNYDGDGYAIRGLNISESSAAAVTNCYGLFGYVASGASIQNLSVYGKVVANCSYDTSKTVFVGGIIGFAEEPYLAGLYNYCDVELNISDSSAVATFGEIIDSIGGVVGLLKSRTQFTYTELENHGKVRCTGTNGRTRVSGVAGVKTISGTNAGLVFSNCKNYGEVSVGDTTGGSDMQTPIVGGIAASHFQAGGGFGRDLVASFSANYGSIVCTGSVWVAGVIAQDGDYGNQSCRANYCTNYGNIRCVRNENVNGYYAGILSSATYYKDSYVSDSVNRGDISVSGSATSGSSYVGGVSASRGAYSTIQANYENKNYGNITVNTPNANAHVGGVYVAANGVTAYNSSNFGSIDATASRVYCGGIASMGEVIGQARASYVRNCFAGGTIKVSYNSTNSRISGIVNTIGNNATTVSNCCFIGKFEGSPDNFSAAVRQAAPGSGKEYIVNNCYAVVGCDQSLFGTVNASSGNVTLSNCVGVDCGGGLLTPPATRSEYIIASITGENLTTNNIGLVSYGDVYHDQTALSGYFVDSVFSVADKETSGYYDLILPIHTVLFPAYTDEVKTLFNFAKVQGYKRYIRSTNNQ